MWFWTKWLSRFVYRPKIVHQRKRGGNKLSWFAVYCAGHHQIIAAKKGHAPLKPGEFTLRAFLNGQLDLSQAEAVADLIASDSKASHQIAMQQLRGGF